MPIDLVIFDCDGVLVDSEVISCRVHARLLSEAGYPITTDQVFERFLGRSSAESNREVEAELGRKLPDGFDARLKQAVIEELAASVESVPHVASTLARIGRQICVASSGIPDKIKMSLTRARLHDSFAPHLFSATQVARGKPAPDLFLFAAATMGVLPARCAVIEDSIPGIVGAKAAGMTAIAFSGGAHYRAHSACAPSPAQLKQAGAARVFDDMRQLPEIIDEIEADTPH